MDFSQFIQSNLGVAVISVVAGSLITALVTRLHGRRARLRYSTRTERLALAADDPVFGNVRITWGGQEVRNLHMVSIEVENASSHDFDDVGLKVFTDSATVLLNERTSVVGTPYIVNWSDSYRAGLAVAAGAQISQDQWNTYNHSREYSVPVLNRGQLLSFSYLCTKPADDGQPAVFVSTQLRGATLRQEARSSFVFGVPQQVAILRGFLVATALVVLCGLTLHSVWAASVICMTVGLFAQALGCLEYKFESWLRGVITG